MLKKIGEKVYKTVYLTIETVLYTYEIVFTRIKSVYYIVYTNYSLTRYCRAYYNLLSFRKLYTVELEM